ncbi:MAG: hypothetical protein A2Z34_01965 [Planctomycetes bacterium RBG_16_59_8]|nr:MAG: hypothetical protein A2Z34_01965 [Planctomycetes bacterium RBG_16_59_8]
MGKDLMMGSRHQVTIPREWIPEGSTLFHGECRDDGSIVLIPHISIPANQAFFWTKRWQEGERTASEDIRSGRVRSFRSADDLAKHLDRKRKR